MSNTRNRRNADTKADTQSGTNIDFQAAPRAAQALRLRRLGYTYDQIAKEVGYTHASAARKLVKKAEDSLVRDEARALVGWQLDRIDMALQVVMKGIVNEGSLWAIDRLTPLLKRQAELMGLDATKDAAATAGQILIRRYDADTDAV